MQFQVPQFLDIEDKIIGPLSLRQFIYLLIGGGILFFLYNLLKLPVFILVAIPIALFTFLLAFYKTGNQSFGQFVLSVIGYITKPSIYTWKKSAYTKTEQEEKALEETSAKIIKKTEKKIAPKKSGLEDLSWKIEIGSMDNNQEIEGETSEEAGTGE